jgi:hypothetical protein
MKEFVKLKITFAVALLATAYTLNPLFENINIFSFSLFGHSITIKFIYHTFMLLLGISVYSFSLQLLSTKKRILISKIGDIVYGLAIISPFIYLILFILSFTITKLAQHYNTSNEFAVHSIISFISIVISIISTSIAYISIRKLSTEQEAKEDRKENIKNLSDVSTLINNQTYDYAIITSSEVITNILKSITKNNHDNMVTLATNAFNKKLISEQLHDDILTLNNLLSTITHTNIRATKEEAKKSQSIIQSLLKINTSDNTVYYKWITSNLDTIINELKQPLSPATKDIIYNVYNAWRYRDGAAAVEMSTIFEEIIDNNLEILFMIFEDDQKQYEQFIHSIDTIFFTDFLGEGYDALCDKRIRFIKSLNIFSDNSQNAVHRQMAKALKDKINHTMIREIV